MSVLSKFHKFFAVISRKRKKSWQKQLAKLSNAAKKLRCQQGIEDSFIVWLGPSFSIHPPTYAHDILFALALYLRGAKIVPVYCDNIQKTACNFYGGVWQGSDFKSLCEKCRAASIKQWEKTPFAPIGLSTFIQETDYSQIQKDISSLTVDEIWKYTSLCINFGSYAKNIAINNEVVAEPCLLQNEEMIGKAHLGNLLLLGKAYRRGLDAIKPDRIVTNDTFYGMWGILLELAKERSIPVYTHWPIEKRAWLYQYNDSCVLRNFSLSWPSYVSQSLSEEDLAEIEGILTEKTTGINLLINTATVGKHQVEKVDMTILDPLKPTVLLPANVIWDLAALDKGIVFKSMIDWIVTTVEWFALRPQYQLIIKAHPAEESPTIPKTRQQVGAELFKRFSGGLPANVFFLSPLSNISAYELFPQIQAGIVFTTTIGMEMGAVGLPVITVAEAPYRGVGFTSDPKTPEEYFAVLEDTLQGKFPIPENTRVLLAKKFIYFLHRHCYLDGSWLECIWGEEPTIKIHKAEDLLEGKNKIMDYILSSVVKGVPIYRENAWPGMDTKQTHRYNSRNNV